MWVLFFSLLLYLNLCHQFVKFITVIHSKHLFISDWLICFITSHPPNLEYTCDIQLNDINSAGYHQKKGSNRESWQQGCINSVLLVENGGTVFCTFCEKEIAKVLPKKIPRTAKIQPNGWQLLYEKYLLDNRHLFISWICRGTDYWRGELN